MSSNKQIIGLTKLLVFLLPLFFWPQPVKFELAKVGLFFCLSFFLILFLLIKTKVRDFENLWQKIDQKWFSWVGILLFSTLLNQKFPFGFLAGGYRHQGVIFFLLLGVFSLVIKTFNLKEKKSVLSWATAAIIIEALVIFGQGIILKLGLPLLSYNQRPIGTLGEPNAVAGFLILGLPILVHSLRQPILLLATLLVTITALAFTSSRTGLLAFLAELIISVFLWRKKLPFKKFFLISCLILLIFAGIGGVWLERDQSPFETRWLIWTLGLRAVKEKPIFGYGAEGIIGAYDTQYQNITRTLEGMIIDRSHNLFLDITLFSGLFGLVVFGRWFWQAFQEKMRRKEWILVALVGILVFSFFQPLGATHWLYLVLLIS